METTTVVTLIGLASTVCSITFGYIGYQKGVRKDAYQKGGHDGSLRADIDYIKRRSDDIILEQKDTNKTLGTLSERLTRVEESSKQAHKRIDKLEQKQ